MNITPTQISSLQPNEIFVFGSNMEGQHLGGAARFAFKNFGAKWGQGFGLQGQSFAIPSLSLPATSNQSLETIKLPISTIKQYVDKFIQFAQIHQDLFFYVTPIGCGIAGFSEAEIAPLFQECIEMPNVALPETFFKILNINENKKNMKQIIKLTENDIHQIVLNTVNHIIEEETHKAYPGKVFKRMQTEKGQEQAGKRSRRWSDRNNPDADSNLLARKESDEEKRADASAERARKEGSKKTKIRRDGTSDTKQEKFINLYDRYIDGYTGHSNSKKK